MERFSCKMAIAPTASISIICGGTSACIEPIPANIYTHKTLSGSFSIRNPYLEKLLIAKSKNSDAVWNSILEQGGSVQHLDFLSAGREGHLQDQLRDRPALADRARRRSHALYRSGDLAEPVHPGRRREMGSADAPLPRVGAGHQVALLSALQEHPARRASPAASRPTTRSTCARSSWRRRIMTNASPASDARHRRRPLGDRRGRRRTRAASAVLDDCCSPAAVRRLGRTARPHPPPGVAQETAMISDLNPEPGSESASPSDSPRARARGRAIEEGEPFDGISPDPLPAAPIKSGRHHIWRRGDRALLLDLSPSVRATT